MKLIVENKLLSVSWILYSFLWLYLIIFAFRKEYDNNFAGAYYFLFVGFFYFSFLAVFLLGLILAAIFNKEKRKFYLLNIPFLFLPILIEIIMENIK
ncbi:MAG: hypothetical protein IPP60_11290 [Sphingobacteriales bacterium]|nr:hypothetical protein [Sphingobacteriales bacterium]MCC6583851.1 hypothetical protein [Chitinophagales bacterium]